MFKKLVGAMFAPSPAGSPSDVTTTTTLTTPRAEHVMLDIETLGKRHNAALLSIGATKFDPFTDKIIDTFYVAADPESCQPPVRP